MHKNYSNDILLKSLSELKNNISKIEIISIISFIASITNSKIYLIGGFIRDFLLSKQSNDIDIVIIDNTYNFIKKLSNFLKKKMKSYKRFGTFLLTYNSFKIEFVEARQESYNINSRNPLIKKSNLYEDQKRRDFTINTIAFSLNNDDFGIIIDPFKGINDIKKNIIRTPIDANKTYSDDPLRMIRAIRIASQINFKISNNSLKSIKLNKNRILIVSIERIIDEFNKILLTNKPSIGIKYLIETELFKMIFFKSKSLINIDCVKDILNSKLKNIDFISNKTNDIWFIWAFLLHDIILYDKKNLLSRKYIYNIISDIFSNLKLPKKNNMKFVYRIIFSYLNIMFILKNNIEDYIIRELILDYGDIIKYTMLLFKTKINQSIIFYKKIKILKTKIHHIMKYDSISLWKSPITGDEIMKLKSLKESKIIGNIQNKIKQAIINGDIKYNKDEIIQYVVNLNIR
ncbi:MAG: CCA tRNA nucleotidyltransferase [Bacteroides sp.]|nr:MAG: CCA tRNA nucleotidyltransferase [Bacteroides sp.]